MKNLSNFGESLNSLLIENEVSPEKLAAALGVVLSTVYYWKNNEKEISLSNLILIADFFTCSLEFLVGRTDSNTYCEKKNCPPFSKRLREVMKEKGISTYALRKRGISSRHFSNWDKGADPFLSTLVNLSAILDCTLDHLVGRE